MARKKHISKWKTMPSRQKYGCDNAGNPIVLPTKNGEYADEKGRVLQVGDMEPELQDELNKILGDLPGPVSHQ